MKFRKKPVVIEAVQLTKELRNNMGPFPEWALPHLDASRTEKIENSEEIYIINPSGRLRVFDGDWIIRGTKEGDVYPCPDDVFQSTYDPSSSAMTFGAAIEAMKSGQKVSRAGWNGKAMWVALSGVGDGPNGGRMTEPKDFWNPDARAFAESVGAPVEVVPTVIMKTAQDTILMGWLASQSDMVAEDWGVVE